MTEVMRRVLSDLSNTVSTDLGQSCSYSIEPLRADAGHDWIVLSAAGLSVEYVSRLLKVLAQKSSEYVDTRHLLTFGVPREMPEDVYVKIHQYATQNPSWSNRVAIKDNSLDTLIALATGQK